MTRKHFEALAKALKDAEPDHNGDLYPQWWRDIQAIADVCERFSPAFDRERFLKATGLIDSPAINR